MLVLRYNEVIFCLHELCRSHTKKNVLSKFVGKKKDSEYCRKKWSVSYVNNLFRKIDKTGSVKRKAGSERPRSA